MSFHSLGLDAQLLQNVEAQGYTLTTPIQKKAIPAILEGRDVVGLAQTGTGKTAAFVLPVLHRLMSGPRRQLRTLIVGPTRELAEQTKDVLIKLGNKTGFRHVTIYGGVGMQPQINGVRQGAEIAIACPGRLLDLLGQGKFNLNHVECLVLDEADRMFDMGFLPDIRKILKRLPAKHQTLLFSATMPDEIRKLAHEILHDPVTVQIAHSKPAETVDHALYPVEQGQKTSLLLELLKTLGDGSVLVFTRTKHRAKRLAAQLSAAGYRATSLQGNLSQRQRQAALDGFKSGHHQILVATDLAARGIDVADITHVINIDMPTTVDDYTHRIGRTGRAAKTGDAFTFTTREDEGAVRAIERLLGFKIERRRIDGFDYSSKPAPLEAASHAHSKPRPHSKMSRPSAHKPGGKPGAKPGGHVPGRVRSFGPRRFSR
jgi:ATP-dependent RNA helicase RhlE